MNIDIINTNIDDYSISELLNLIGLNNPRKEEIIERIEFLNSNHFKNKSKINNFLIEIQNQLLSPGQTESLQHVKYLNTY